MIHKVGNSMNKSIKCTADCMGDKNNSKNSCMPLCVSVLPARRLTAFNYRLRHSVEIFNL